MDKPVSCEKNTQKVGRGNGSQTAREDDLHDQKKFFCRQKRFCQR